MREQSLIFNQKNKLEGFEIFSAGGEQCDGGGGQEKVSDLPHHLEGACVADAADDGHDHDVLDDSGDDLITLLLWFGK